MLADIRISPPQTYRTNFLSSNMHYQTTVNKLNRTNRPIPMRQPKPVAKIPLVVIENDGFAFLQAELSALTWDLHVQGADLHAICKRINQYAHSMGLEAHIRLKFALEEGVPAYLGAKVRSTIVSVNLG